MEGHSNAGYEKCRNNVARETLKARYMLFSFLLIKNSNQNLKQASPNVCFCVLYVEPAGTRDSLSGSKVGAGKECGWGTEVGMNSNS